MVGPSLNTLNHTATIKFLCSYGGRILPRYPDGKLRYQGGETRVLSVDRSISYAELVVKLGEMCGTSSMSLRCQLPKEDLDALVSITSDEDLANLIEEYDRAVAAGPPASIKIRAFLSTPKTTKKAEKDIEIEDFSRWKIIILYAGGTEILVHSTNLKMPKLFLNIGIIGHGHHCRASID
ncbi:putative Octicosapeptide/Phox/Bem1p family protein isoform 1 [Forsythia ovata]|uniref:Octicosapeptide/Phox/Bem1p family protein isoform 1 n=1 Tax=Forsythia ovata TaxID=205694 RepID=A0ABD1WF77_9LAMI